MLLCLLLLSSARSLAPVPNCIRYRQSISHGHGWRHTGTTCQLSLHSNRSVASWPLPSATCVPYPNPHDARNLISFISPAPSVGPRKQNAASSHRPNNLAVKRSLGFRNGRHQMHIFTGRMSFCKVTASASATQSQTPRTLLIGTFDTQTMRVDCLTPRAPLAGTMAGSIKWRHCRLFKEPNDQVEALELLSPAGFALIFVVGAEIVGGS